MLQKNPKSNDTFDTAGCVLPETAVNNNHWKLVTVKREIPWFTNAAEQHSCDTDNLHNYLSAITKDEENLNLV